MAQNQNIEAAKETYVGFLNFFKWGAIVVAIVVAAVILIIAG